MSSKKCRSYVCRMISRKLRRDMQVTSLPVVEPNRGKAAGDLPELQTVGIGWPGLVGPDIIVYNQNQQAKTGEPPPPAPSIMLTPPRGAPWHLSGITDGGIAVNKLKYLAAAEGDAGEPTKHIHEHHHYDCSYKAPKELPSVVRTGYLLVRPKQTDDPTPPPPRPNPNRFQNNGIFLPRNNRRSFENGPIYYPQYGPYFNCPFYGNPNAVYAQNQRFPFSNAPIVGQHHHFHQHFYHSQYQYQQAMNYQHHQQFRFLAHQQPRMQFNQHSHHHYRPYFDHNDTQVWADRSEYNGRAIVKLY